MRAMAASQRLWALFALLLCMNVALAGILRPIPRQDDASTTADSITATASVTSSSAEFSAVSSTREEASATTSASSSIITGTSTVSATSSVSAAPSSSASSISFNVTIPAGQLPLKPAITPGLSVGGVVLMISGAAYAMIGIKTRWLHCFCSVGFLAALGVTVLILYVMNPPISNAVQAGYVMAALATGALLGGASLIFKDVLECLACLLGGFCLAMWLLTLRAGGLIGSGGAGVVIFICAFSVAGLGGFFSRWTREYFMIACIAFSGSTAVVIGIDCFTRAGLKEFWAWIWDVNANLFPLGADTYPLTRGIRVEQAATILIFLCGIMSQTKIWKVIKERRARKGEERRKDEAVMQEEDEAAGRKIEGQNAREMRDWDAVYGNPKSLASVHTAHTAHDSGLGDMDSEKKHHRTSGSGTTVTQVSVVSNGDHIEMMKMLPKPPKAAAELVMGKNDNDGIITVQVAVDEVTTPAREIMPERVVQAEKTRNGGKPSAESLRAAGQTPIPQVVPLPFKVPTTEDEELRDDADCSSIAAVPDHVDNLQETQSVGSKRSSFAKRLSASSADLFRRISQHSMSRQLEQATREGGESTEELTSHERADRDSVAATFDDASVSGGRSERALSREIEPEALAKGSEEAVVTVAAAKEGTGERPTSYASTGILDPAAIPTTPEQQTEDETKPGKSMVSEVTSGPVSLTKEHLPARLSKVALSYRTNEWAKHLSYADLPATEELNIPEPIAPAAATVDEPAAPVNMQELQKTAVNAAPPPAMPRTASAMSMARASNVGVPAGQSSRRTSARMGGAIAEGDEPDSSINSKARQAAVQAAAAALVGESPRTLPWRPPVPGVVSYDSPQTLIGKRDMIMRIKNSALRSDADLASHDSKTGAVPALGPDSLSSSRRSSGTYAAAGQPSSHQKHTGGPPLAHRNNKKQYNFERNPGTPPSTDADLDDDIPLSQRRTLIRERRSSTNSMNSNSAGNNTPSRRSSFGYASPPPLVHAATSSNSGTSSPATPMNLGGALGSPAPVARRSDLPSQSGSRDSLVLRQSYSQPRMSSSGPLINAVYGIPGTSSNHSLPAHQRVSVLDAEAQRDLDAQRKMLMGQKEAEARRRESRRAEQARGERQFETRMRTDSQMMELHREAMRKMQRKVTS